MTNKFDTQYKEVPIKEKENNEKVEIPTSFGFGVRHIQVLLTFSCLCITYLARAHLGVTIVAMTTPPDLKYNITNSIAVNVEKHYGNNITDWKEVDTNNFTVVDKKYALESLTARNNSADFINNKNRSIMTFDWPKSTHEMILGAFSLGYAVTMFPMGMVSQRWGAKIPMQIALLVNSITAICAPWLVVWGGWKAICACRILDGVAQAGLLPSVQIMAAKWAHLSERGKFISFLFTGTMLGTIIAFQIAGVLAASPWGWPSVFWVVGGLNFLMFIIMTVFGAAVPTDHKRISEQEKLFITGKVDDGFKKRRPVPWRAILTSKHVWAIIVTHVGSGTAYVFFFYQTPSYIHYILKMDVKKSGLLSSLPYVASFIMNIVYGFLSDFLTNRNILSVANARRFFNSLSQIGMGLCFVAVSFTKSVEIALGCLVLALAFKSGIHLGWMVNLIDLAHNFNGTLMAFGNTITCFTVLIIPVLVSFIVTDVTNQLQWRILFVGMATLSFLTNIFFVVFMSSDTQPWNDYEETEPEDKGKKEMIPI